MQWGNRGKNVDSILERIRVLVSRPVFSSLTLFQWVHNGPSNSLICTFVGGLVVRLSDPQS